ncbi:hypothetical protein TNCV_635791 [Trichonephila clavipes]|nr:hypothetical protein TNCV_635791 [Trichonephila clavipes]
MEGVDQFLVHITANIHRSMIIQRPLKAWANWAQGLGHNEDLKVLAPRSVVEAVLGEKYVRSNYDPQMLDTSHCRWIYENEPGRCSVHTSGEQMKSRAACKIYGPPMRGSERHVGDPPLEFKRVDSE